MAVLGGVGAARSDLRGVIPLSLRQVTATICAALTALVLAAPAAAQNTPVTQEQYGDKAEQFGGGGGSVGDPGDPSASDPGTVGSLPFTGLDLGLMAAAAAGLVAGGVVLRRRSTAEDHGG